MNPTANKYIFLAGVPGSKWSLVSLKIYDSPSIDRSDYCDDWVVYSYTKFNIDNKTSMQLKQLMHIGSYFDPGMACSLPENLSDLSKQQLEQLFDSAFTEPWHGKPRIIKSHIFCYKQNLFFLKKTWPECPIVMVYRDDQACFAHWIKTGGFDLPYPNYRPYYKNLDLMQQRIKEQNAGIREWWNHPHSTSAADPKELATLLNISCSKISSVPEYWNNFSACNVEVKVI